MIEGSPRLKQNMPESKSTLNTRELINLIKRKNLEDSEVIKHFTKYQEQVTEKIREEIKKEYGPDLSGANEARIDIETEGHLGWVLCQAGYIDEGLDRIWTAYQSAKQYEEELADLVIALDELQIECNTK